jgi:hypothetical protein
MRFDPDDLSLIDWAHIEAVDSEPAGPWDQPWPENTPLLSKLAVWAGYALWRRQLDDELGGTYPGD